MSVGKRIYLKRNMPDPEIVEQFKSIPASNTADVMGRSCAMNPRIHLVSSPKAQMMAGPAFTVKCRAGDNLALHAALNFCQEGDVLVVSNEEDNTRSLMGEVMMAFLYLQKKVAGIILDGPIRDIDEIGKWDFPVYCTGTTPGRRRRNRPVSTITAAFFGPTAPLRGARPATTTRSPKKKKRHRRRTCVFNAFDPVLPVRRPRPGRFRLSTNPGMHRRARRPFDFQSAGGDMCVAEERLKAASAIHLRP